MRDAPCQCVDKSCRETVVRLGSPEDPFSGTKRTNGVSRIQTLPRCIFTTV